MTFNKLAKDLLENKILSKTHRRISYKLMYALLLLAGLSIINKGFSYLAMCCVLLLLVDGIYSLTKVVLYYKKYKLIE